MDSLRLEAAEIRASAAAAAEAARRLEGEGGAAQSLRLERFHRKAAAVASTTAVATTEAGRAHDAETPLETDRAARIAGHDRELCRLAPAVCAAAPTAPPR